MSSHIARVEEGLVIVESENNGLETISKSDLMSMMNDGIVLFRKFDINVTKFSDFINKHSQRVTIDPARVNTEKNTQLVDAGLDAVGLHVENGNTPFLPHCIWFFCEKAASQGSQTTYCDGKKVWEDLSESTRTFFEKRRIKYQRKISESIWKKYLAAELPNVSSVNEITVDDLKRVSNKLDGLDIKINDDMSIQLAYAVSAFNRSIFSGKIAFANSLLGPSYNYETPIISLENDDPIPDSIWSEIKEATGKNTRDIPWESGDMLVIDNTRFMHGRRKIEDSSRRIHAAMSYM